MAPASVPDSDWIEALTGVTPLPRLEISKMPLLMTAFEVAMLPLLPPLFIRSSSPVELIVVRPV